MIRCREAVFISAVTEAEFRAGVAIMPDGRRRASLEVEVEAMIVADRRRSSRPIDGAESAE